MLQTAKVSLDEYHAILASGALSDRHLELLEGEIVERPSEGSPHSGLANDVAEYLRQGLGDRARIREGYSITLPDCASEPIPDIAIVRPLGSIYRTRNPLPTDVFGLIEVAYSSLARDLGKKAEIYAQGGIQEYWVIDVKGAALVVHRNPRGDRFRWVQEWGDGAIAPLAFPDLSFSVPMLLGRS